MKQLLVVLAFSISTICAGQGEYKTATEVYNVYNQSAEVIAGYSFKYVKANMSELFKTGAESVKEIPLAYRQQDIIKGGDSVIARGVLWISKQREKCGQVYIYGEVAFFAKDNRAKYILRNVQYIITGNNSGCRNIGNTALLAGCSACRKEYNQYDVAISDWYARFRKSYKNWLADSDYSDTKNW